MLVVAAGSRTTTAPARSHRRPPTRRRSAWLASCRWKYGNASSGSCPIRPAYAVPRKCKSFAPRLSLSLCLHGLATLVILAIIPLTSLDRRTVPVTNILAQYPRSLLMGGVASSSLARACVCVLGVRARINNRCREWRGLTDSSSRWLHQLRALEMQQAWERGRSGEQLLPLRSGDSGVRGPDRQQVGQLDPSAPMLSGQEAKAALREWFETTQKKARELGRKQQLQLRQQFVASGGGLRLPAG
eukprot:COSAG01_NODE_12640_length_1706_cov_1.959552_2_plen_244_part_00